MSVLVDTNLLLRSLQPGNPHFQIAVDAIATVTFFGPAAVDGPLAREVRAATGGHGGDKTVAPFLVVRFNSKT